MIRFSVLGPLRVSLGDQDVTPGPFKARAVLALLLLRAGTAVTLPLLLRRVWDTPPPATVVASARNIVSALRRTLADVPGVTLATMDRGYRLVVPVDSLDVAELETLLGDGQVLAASDDPAAAAVSFRRAIDLWHGSTLTDLTAEGLRWPEIERLEERRLEAHERWLDAELACGRHRSILPELLRLVRDHPEREELHRLRIVALHRSGRRGDAAEAYAQAREALRVHAGRAPGRGIQDVHEALLSATRQGLAPRPAASGASAMPHKTQPVRRSDTGAPGPAMPLEGGPAGALNYDLRSVAVVCVRGPGAPGTADPAGEARQLWCIVHETVDTFGGVRQLQDGGEMVAYFGLDDPAPVPSDGPAEAGPSALEQATACALAVRGALLRDRRRDGDLAGHLRPPFEDGRPDEAVAGANRAGQAPSGSTAPAPVAVVVTTGTIMHMIRVDTEGRAHPWIAGEVVDRCAERARTAPDGVVWII
ncbi:BTAD domain-containing putative transcriptional regulator [Streptomyces sp. NPDC059943]|uniref:AfsR/SARP family transcriptional regulator n=1 Tax=unclassified Streptomyces TaxID=2593676 RepID=UPI003651BDF1